MTRNVQQQSKDVYLRAQEALHCRVHSTLVLPLYRQVLKTFWCYVFADLTVSHQVSADAEHERSDATVSFCTQFVCGRWCAAADKSQLPCSCLSGCICLLCRHADRRQVAGVLEVIQTSEDMVFIELVEILSQVQTNQLHSVLQNNCATILLAAVT